MKIAIIGTGGVAEAFALAFAQQNIIQVDVVVVGRNVERLDAIAKLANCETQDISQEKREDLTDADLYILAVSDSAIASLAESLQFRHGSTVVHTAGSVDVGVLSTKNTREREVEIGVIYPLQSFTPARRVDMREVPIFVECVEKKNIVVFECANILSNNTLELPSNVRVKLHLGAVFASNFVNMLFSATEMILDSSKELQLETYKPLIMETLTKAFESDSPRNVQTGPAKRNDALTMNRHIDILSKENAELTETYKIVSKLIWETSKKM